MVRVINELPVAFDPIFYMHHANVDRIYAFWEYVYPDYWIGQGWKDQDGTIVSFGMSKSAAVQTPSLTHSLQQTATRETLSRIQMLQLTIRLHSFLSAMILRIIGSQTTPAVC